MSVNSILPITFQGETFSGGLEDIGQFSEGYCFKVENRLEESWNLCCNQLEEKIRWLGKLQQLIRTNPKVELKEEEQKLLEQTIQTGGEEILEIGNREQREGYWRVV